MDPGELGGLLKDLRRVRRGTLSAAAMVPPLADYMGHGLGRLCDLLASRLEADTDLDRRGVDAAIRYFGLGRMPEPLASIAAGLRSLSGRRGITIRQTQDLIRATVARAERQDRRTPLAVSPVDRTSPADPFPMATKLPRRALAKVLLWAWADAPAPPGPEGPALMLYEREHGLRAWAPEPHSRSERQRSRRLAWSMVAVAAYRRAEAVPTDPLVGRVAGARYLAVVDGLDTDGLDALLAATMHPVLGDLREALQLVRTAVKDWRPEAAELLGLFRDAASRTRSVPPDVQSKVLALSAIVAHRQRDPAGMLLGVQAVQHAADILGARVLSEADAVGRVVVSDALRASQESAELSFSLGDARAAWATLRHTRAVLEAYGDPERDIEPDGWRQQWMLSSVSVGRRLALLANRPRRWLEAAGAAADESAALALDRGLLPTTWGLAALSQRAGIALDLAQLAAIEGDSDATTNLVRAAYSRLDALDKDWGALDPDHAVRSGLLAVARGRWRAALIEGDLDSIPAARDAAWARVDDSTPPETFEKLEELDAHTLVAGLAPRRRTGNVYRDRLGPTTVTHECQQDHPSDAPTNFNK